MNTAWLLWLASAAVLLFTFPIGVRWSGTVKEYLYRLLLFALPIEVCYILGFRDKVAGYQGIQVSPTLLIATLLVLLILAQGKATHAQRRVPRRGWLPASLFFLTGVLSMFGTGSTGLTFFGLFEMGSVILLSTVAAHFCSSQSGIVATRRMLLVTLGVQVCILLFQNVTGVSIDLTGRKQADAALGELSSYWGRRYTGTMASPSVTATFLVVALLFLLGGLIGRLEQRHRPRKWALVGLGLLSLVLTLTRTAWAGFAIGLVVLVLQKPMREHLRVKAVLTAALLLAIVAGTQWTMVQQRADAASDDWIVRWNLNLIAWEMIKAHPITGVGLNDATQVIRRYAAMAPLIKSESGTAWIFIPHNQFLLVASEMGIPGLLAWLMVMAAAIRSARQAARSADPTTSTAGAMLTACLVMFVWALNFDHVNGAQTYALLWFVMGAAHGARQLAEDLEQPNLGHVATKRFGGSTAVAIPPRYASVPRVTKTGQPTPVSLRMTRS